jgi:hypothetical protein
MVEARGNTPLHDADAMREVAEEESGLVALDLPVLDGGVLEVGVELDGLVHGSASLILLLLLLLLLLYVRERAMKERSGQWVERTRVVLSPSQKWRS